MPAIISTRISDGQIGEFFPPKFKTSEVFNPLAQTNHYTPNFIILKFTIAAFCTGFTSQDKQHPAPNIKYKLGKP
jgi:hypothetical protein